MPAAGAIDNTEERRLAPLTAAEEANPPRAKVCTPLYEAKVDPDIYFFGFDLRSKAPRAAPAQNPDDDPGLVLRHQGAPGRAALRARYRQAAEAAASGTICPGRTCSRPAGRNIEISHRAGELRADLKPTGIEDQEKATQYRRRQGGVEPRHELGGARLHPVPGAGAGRRPRQGNAAEVK